MTPEIVINEKKPRAAKNSPEAKPVGYITADGGIYIAQKKCYFGISLYQKGAEYHSTKGEKIPYHFRKKGKKE